MGWGFVRGLGALFTVGEPLPGVGCDCGFVAGGCALESEEECRTVAHCWQSGGCLLLAAVCAVAAVPARAAESRGAGSRGAGFGGAGFGGAASRTSGSRAAREARSGTANGAGEAGSASEAAFRAAAGLRAQLEATPAGGRSRAEYAAVLDGFRAVYHRWPTAGKAPAAVEAVAELLAEEGATPGVGRRHDLEAARGEYAFLLAQYPKSPEVAEALLNQGELCGGPLQDKACARTSFAAVRRRFPGSSYAEQAEMDLRDGRRSAAGGSSAAAGSSAAGGERGLAAARLGVAAAGRGVAAVGRGAAAIGGSGTKAGATRTAGTRPDGIRTAETMAAGTNAAGIHTAGIRPAGARAADAVAGAIPDSAAVAGPVRMRAAAMAAEGAVRRAVPGQATTSQAVPKLAVTQPVPVTAGDAPVAGLRGGAFHGRTVEVTGIRHWSNPVSTRIAIDLGGEVEYEAARVMHPDRIFFDLHGARLSRGLNGREVQVIDDGYLKRIRVAQYRPDVTRVVLDVTDVSDYSAFLLPNPWRLILDIHGGRRAAAPSSQAAVPDAQRTPQTMRALGVAGPVARGQDGSGADASGAGMAADVAALSSAPTRVAATSGPTTAPVAARFASAVPTARDAVRRARGRANSRAATATSAKIIPATHTATSMAEPAAAAQPTADGERSLVRALGLKVNRIVIDAGHGGHDSGTLGPGGIEEKDVVLDVALRTGRLLEKRMGAKVIYTRDDDTFVPLETRTAIANKAQADLFLSIHANSSPEPAARGVETYYLNFTTDPQALEVAARENAVSDAGVHQLSDLVRKIALKDKIEESREFAADVDASLYHGLGDGAVDFKDRGVKKAPFVVLIGAQMPSVLAEISFLTNPEDAQLLRQPAWRQRIAESLAAGVERYLSGLSSTRPVLDHASEQAQSQNGEEPAVDQR